MRVIGSTLLMVVASLTVASSATSFENVATLRAEGRYDEAIAILERVLADKTAETGERRRAHSELVFTLLEADRVADARTAAQLALLEFPDLRADPSAFPAAIESLYQELRAQLFGSLSLETDPEHCEVRVDDDAPRTSPLLLHNLPAGQYEVQIRKQGYAGRSVWVQVDPARLTSLTIALERITGFESRERKRWGVELAGNYGYTTYRDADGARRGGFDNGHWRFGGGFFFEFGLTPRLFLRTGARLGFVVHEEETVGSTRTAVMTETLGTLSAPMLVRFVPNPSSGWFIMVGPELALRVRPFLVPGSSVRDRNFVLTGGGGYEFGARRRFSIHSQVAFGMVDITRGSAAKSEWKTREVRVLLGVVR